MGMVGPSPTHPDQIGARNLWREFSVGRTFRKAVKKGLLKRPPSCTLCGSSGRIEGHHPDYYQPFFVKWVCRLCHRRIHSKKGHPTYPH